MQENAAQKSRSQYRPGVDFVNPISRLSTAGQIYSVKLRPENDYDQTRYEADTSRPVELRPMQAPHFTLLDYIKDAFQPTDNGVLGKQMSTRYSSSTRIHSVQINLKRYSLP